MYYVYVLLCADGKLYTGYSADLRKRVARHEKGEVPSTKGRRPVKLVFYEAFLHRKEGRVDPADIRDMRLAFSG